MCLCCGYQVEVSEKEVYDYAYDECSICHAYGSFDRAQKEKKGISQASEDLMREQIAAMGNDRVWALVEQLKTANIRLEYRQLFFKVGGRVPEKELII